MHKSELEERLITFAIRSLDIADKIFKTYAGAHLSKQITRSGTSPALNYAEALGAESRQDFIHKIKIVLKELRETHICSKIIKYKPLTKNISEVELYIKECNELISIFVASINTASKNKSQITIR